MPDQTTKGTIIHVSSRVLMAFHITQTIRFLNICLSNRLAIIYRVYYARAINMCFMPHAVIAVNYEANDAISTSFTRIYTQWTRISLLNTGKWVIGGAKLNMISVLVEFLICMDHMIFFAYVFYIVKVGNLSLKIVLISNFHCGMPMVALDQLWGTKCLRTFWNRSHVVIFWHEYTILYMGIM